MPYCDDDGVPRADDNFEMTCSHLDWIYVSCWTQTRNESYPMWRLYGGWNEKDSAKNPAVCVTISDHYELKRCLDQHLGHMHGRGNSAVYKKPEKTKNMGFHNTIFFGKEMPPDRQLAISMDSLTLKHESYEFENEYRFICAPADIPAQSENQNIKRPNPDQNLWAPIHQKENLVCSIKASPFMSDTDFRKLRELCAQTAWNVEPKRSELELACGWKKPPNHQIRRRPFCIWRIPISLGAARSSRRWRGGRRG